MWRFAGVHATDQAVVLSVLALLFLNAFNTDLFGASVSLVERVEIVLLASFFAWLWFTVAGAVLNLVAKPLSEVRVTAVVIIYALTEVIRIFSVIALIGDSNSDAQYDLRFTLLGGATTGIVLCALVATGRTDFLQFREIYLQLATHARRLQAHVKSTASEVSVASNTLVDYVRRELDQALTAALRASALPAASSSAMADELFRISDEVVRPLSRELSRAVPEVRELAFDRKPPRTPVKALLNDITTAEPFQPIQLFIITVLLAAPTAFLFRSPLPAVLGAVSMGLVFGLSWLGRKYLTPRFTGWPLLLRALVMTVLFAIPMLTFGVTAVIPSVPGLELSPAVAAYAGLLGALLGWLVAFSAGLAAARERILQRVIESDEQLQWLNVRMQAQLWLDQKRFALTLHNDVQGTLLAAALKLRAAIEAGTDATAQAVPEVQRMVRGCIELQAPTVPSNDLRAVVAAVNQNWAPLIELKLEASDELIRDIESDPVAAEIVAELLREFQANSLKHGRASLSTVTLTGNGGRSLGIRMRNNGERTADRIQTAGLGSEFLSSVSLWHEVRDLEDGVEVNLELPLERQPV